MTPYLPLRKRSKIPIKLFNESGPFNKFLFNDVLFNDNDVLFNDNDGPYLSRFIYISYSVMWYTVSDTRQSFRFLFCKLLGMSFIDVLI